MSLTYEELTSKADNIPLVVKEAEWAKMDGANQLTCRALIDMHLANMEENIRSGLWDKHGPMSHGLQGIGFGKAVIGIGAGPSYNLNSNVLRQIHDYNFTKSVDDQPFLFISSNHQWKHCMKNGIYPHFVIIVDAGDVLLEQLCKDIPDTAFNTILLTGLHTSPSVLKEWDSQGRPIQFYVPGYDKKRDLFAELTKEDPAKFQCEEGGNVLNMAWIVARKFMHSTVFMSVGNDLCFPIEHNPMKRRKLYYADGDYTSNLKNKRDEARNKMACMGFKIEWNPIIQQDVINLHPFWTSWQLWVYKKWIEAQVCMTDAEEDCRPFHYYNCSESGILGVIGKSNDKKDFDDKRNWILMDQIVPKRWHTVRLKTAIGSFLKARDLWLRGQENSTKTSNIGETGLVAEATGAKTLLEKTSTASFADLRN